MGESIVIPAINAKITITEIKGEKARLGIEAPSDIIVDRQEVHLRRGQGAASPTAAAESKEGPSDEQAYREWAEDKLREREEESKKK